MTTDGGQRIATSDGAMLADPESLGNVAGAAAPGAAAAGAAMPGVTGPGAPALGIGMLAATERGVAVPGAVAPSVIAELFEPAFWAQRGELVEATRGRGSAWFVSAAPHQWVLRHYRRGGFIARLSADRYLWAGEERVRAFAEWRLLAALTARHLPVPRPIAARYQRLGALYRCDLLTLRIAGAEPLSARLSLGALAGATWREVGVTIGRLHAAGVDHADLNAHNILLDEAGAVSVIDFDRGRLRAPGAWVSGNMSRLRRSLFKISRELPPDRFSASAWRSLLDGYTSAPPL